MKERLEMMRLLIIMTCLLLFVTGVWAEEVELKVVRVGANLYQVPAEDLFIQTEYCFEDATNKAVVLLLGEAGDRLLFNGPKNGCDIKMVYGRSKVDAGNYQLKVTKVDDDWYGLVDQDVALKTNGCLSQVENVAAEMVINEDGTGTLSIPEADENCQVEGVYSKAELSVGKK